jgi:transcriptional regulator with XRE-family HTH domain
MPSDDFRIIAGSQLRAARALVRWSIEDLAESSRVAVTTITHAEAQDGPVSVTAADTQAMRRALEGAGVEFIAEDGGGIGVRFAKRSGRPDEGLRPDQLTSENDS